MRAMPKDALPRLTDANASFVTPQLLVGGDLDTRSSVVAARQLIELLSVGVTHIVDVRIEWSDEEWVRGLVPELAYLHHGMDDIGQRVPPDWFETGVGWVRDAMQAGGVVLAHCHMGINRGPSLGLAVLLAEGWDVVDALDAIRDARPEAYAAYADDALRWHHGRTGSDPAALKTDLARVAAWRQRNYLDLADVIRLKREEEAGGP
jgi:protein-tyrosine phosphatase